MRQPTSCSRFNHLPLHVVVAVWFETRGIVFISLSAMRLVPRTQETPLSSALRIGPIYDCDSLCKFGVVLCGDIFSSNIRQENEMIGWLVGWLF